MFYLFLDETKILFVVTWTPNEMMTLGNSFLKRYTINQRIKSNRRRSQQQEKKNSVKLGKLTFLGSSHRQQNSGGLLSSIMKILRSCQKKLGKTR